jgi:hypothetical protein
LDRSEYRLQAGKTCPIRVKGPQTQNYAFGNPNADSKRRRVKRSQFAPQRPGKTPSTPGAIAPNKANSSPGDTKGKYLAEKDL